VIAVTSLVNTVVAMAVEACLTVDTPPDQVGRVSAWYQAGNLGGTGLGGGLGLWLLETLPQPWMAGALMGTLMVACCGALVFVRELPAAPHRVGEIGLVAAVRSVASDLVRTLRTTGGMLAALLLVLPVGTGAGSGVLTQAEVAAHWGAGVREVGLMQGTLAGLVTAAGCFAGGALCRRIHPRSAYAMIGLVLAAIGSSMALAPATVTTYVVASTIYNFAVGMAYAAYSATTLDAIGHTAGATKFSTMASLANFPIWWLGLLLGWVADHRGPASMLHTEAVLGVLGVGVFTLAAVRARRLAPAM
jgi:MFS transporter, PAT family, beta-lactamase induction signal transducer AmpG